jgi:medium-chain acyl-[acyl-carrier-protein] hydrolase
MPEIANGSRWLLYPKPNKGAALRLFCFHYAGGSAQAFQSWSAELPSRVELGLVQLPGRGARIGEPRITNLLPLSRMIARELSRHLDKPFAFFGHSLGAMLCFEVARALREEAQPEPAHLFLSAAEAPHRRNREETLSTLPKAQLLKKLHEFNGTPVEALCNEELMDLLLPTIRADFTLCETYQYSEETPLSCPLTIYGGIDDAEVDRERIAAWSELVRGATNIRMFPGGHFFIHTSKSLFLPAFAADLRRLCSHLPAA